MEYGVWETCALPAGRQAPPSHVALERARLWRPLLTQTVQRILTRDTARVASSFCWQTAQSAGGSKLLPTAATSTMEAEYMAHGNAAKQALWLRKGLVMLCGAAGPVTMYCDCAIAWLRCTTLWVIRGGCTLTCSATFCRIV
jgi:hypothetical protein